MAEIEELIIPRFFTVAFDPKYPKRPANFSPSPDVSIFRLKIVCPWPSNVPLNWYGYSSTLPMSFPIGVKFDCPAWAGLSNLRLSVRITVYPEKSLFIGCCNWLGLYVPFTMPESIFSSSILETVIAVVCRISPSLVDNLSSDDDVISLMPTVLE